MAREEAVARADPSATALDVGLAYFG